MNNTKGTGFANFLVACFALGAFWFSASEVLKFMADSSGNSLNWAFVFFGMGLRLTILSTQYSILKG